MRKSKLIAEIKALHAKREALNISAVKRRLPELLAAVYRERPFWGWKSALADAGIGYEQIVVELETHCICRVCGKESPNLSRHLWGIHKFQPGEYRERFPGAEILSESMRAKKLGLCAHTSKKMKIAIPHWEPLLSPEYVLDRLAEHARRGFTLNWRHLNQADGNLPSQVRQYFGSLDRGLEIIGLDPNSIRCIAPPVPQPKKIVIEGLRQYFLEHGTLRGMYQSIPRITYLADRNFESIRQAVEAAGIDPERAGLTPIYDGERKRAFIAEARLIAMLRGSARLQALAAFKAQSRRAAANFFGNWTGAAAAIGVPSWKLSCNRVCSKGAVLELVEEWLAKGNPLTQSALLKGDFSLMRGIVRQFGGLPALRKWIAGSEGKDLSSDQQDRQ